MPNTPHPDELVVLIGPEGHDGDGIRDALASWARTELIRPCYWLTPQDSTSGVIEGRRLDVDGATSVVLPDDLGDVKWERCHIVLVQPLSRQATGDPKLVEFAVQYASFMRRTILPMGTTLVRLNLLVPTWDMTTEDAPGLNTDLLVDGWEQTVVASPEERASPEHPNVLVRADKNLIGHAAIAAASTGGLWVGMDESPFEHLIPESGGGEAAPRLMRTFVRAVRGGEVSYDLAKVALLPRDGRWRVPMAEGRPVGAATDPQGLIEDAVAELKNIDGGALVYATPPLPITPVKKGIGWHGVWEAFTELCLLVWHRLGAIPAQIKVAAEAKATNKLFGEGGAHSFQWNADVANGLVGLVHFVPENETDDGTIFGQARLAERALTLLGREGRPGAVRAQACIDLRQLCLGMVDAGSLPEGLDPPMAGAARQVITEPGRLVPDSRAPRFAVQDDTCRADKLLEPYRGMVLPSCDPLLTARLERDLTRVADEYTAGARAETEWAAQKDTEAAAYRKEASAAIAANADADVSDLETLATAAERESAEAKVRAAQNQEWADHLTTVIRELTDWATPRLNTLMWRVGETVGGHLERATIDQRQALERVTSEVGLDVEAIDRARRRVLRVTLISFLILATASTVAVMRFDLRWAPAAGAVLFLLIFANAFTRYTRVRSECEWTFAQSLANRENALNLLAHAAQEVSRLSMIYRYYLEWAEIIGFQAHQPWVLDERTRDRAPVTPIDHETMPAALVVGSGRVDGDTLAALSAQVAKDLQPEGWLQNSFNEGRDFSMNRLAKQEGASVINFDPDGAGSTDPTTARQFLLDDLRASRPQVAAFRGALDHISSFCSEMAPDQIFQRVSLDETHDRDITEFLSELLPQPGAQIPGFPVYLVGAVAQVKGAYEVSEAFVWAPPGIGAGSGSVRHLPVPTTKSGQYVLQTVRIDVTHEVSVSDLTMFAPPVAIPPEHNGHKTPQPNLY
jgi:hypothetical protein